MKLNELDLEAEYPEGHAMGQGRKKGLEYKEKKVKGVLDRVIVMLKGTESARMTRLAKRYFQLQEALKRMNAKKDTLNKQMKSELVRLFDAEDEVMTRVVETAQATITLGKKEQRKAPDKFDAEGFREELYQLLNDEMVPELIKKVSDLEEKYTIIGEVKEISPSLRVKQKNESLNEAKAMNKIKAFVKRYVAQISQWAKSYDKKLAMLKNAV